MDLWQLHIFVKVVELKSFSRAAEACHLSQPTVSTHIKELEEHFGCRLIDRLGRSIQTTPGGELLLSFARRMLRLKDETQSAMSAFVGQPSGRLVIGGSTIPGTYLLPGLIASFKRKFPEITLSLVIADTKSVAKKTLEGEVELGVVGAMVSDKRLVQEPLVEDDIRLIVQTGHPLADQEKVTVEDLGKHAFLLREPGSGTRKSLEKILARAGHGINELSATAEMGSTEAVRAGILAGLGISILSVRAVAQDLAEGSLKALKVEGLDNQRLFYLVYHSHRTPSPLCAEFKTFLQDEKQKGNLCQ